MDKIAMRRGRMTLIAALVGVLACPAWADSRLLPMPERPSVAMSAAAQASAASRAIPVPRQAMQGDDGIGLAPPSDGILVASARPLPRPVTQEMPDLRWDHVRGSGRWTRAAMRAIDDHGNGLIETVPRDIGEWCPAYPQASDWDRKAFWVGLLSTLSKHESTYRQTAVGGGGLWYGLVQILPATARGYGCEARSGEALKDGELNMSCAVRIMNLTVPRDGVVSRGMRGVAADWGPFHSARKREDMRAWVSAQPFCNGLTASARPVMRPDRPEGEPEVVPLFVAWELDKQFHATPSWSDYLVAENQE